MDQQRLSLIFYISKTTQQPPPCNTYYKTTTILELYAIIYRIVYNCVLTYPRKINECNETKIILNSAYDVDYVLIKELENGNYISKYIQKPFDTDRLTDLVAEIV